MDPQLHASRWSPVSIKDLPGNSGYRAGLSVTQHSPFTAFVCFIQFTVLRHNREALIFKN
jgi:hypothetical protein